MDITVALVFLCVGLVTLILISGFVVMIKGGKVSEKWSNKLMVFRVAAQALAIALLFLIYFLNKE